MSSAPLFSLGPIDQLGDDEIVGVCISGGIKRDGDEWCPGGIDLTNYKANPIVLRGHNPDYVVGSALAIGLINANEIGIRIKFAPPGVSDIADETRGLVKAGVLSGISAGIDPTEIEPLDPKNPYGAMRIVRAELLEVSIVPVPADVDARVTARALASRPGGAALLQSLPALSAAAVQRALRHVGRACAPQMPIMSLSVYDRTAFYAAAHQQRSRAIWACGQARQAEQRGYSYEARQAELARLRSTDEPELRTPARPRLRPYGG
jgi:HK97 family phage prohead protease